MPRSRTPYIHKLLYKKTSLKSLIINRFGNTAARLKAMKTPLFKSWISLMR